MKKPVLALAAVLCASLVTLSETARSQLPGQPGSGPFGPGDKGATFKAPWDAGSGAATPSVKSGHSPSTPRRNRASWSRSCGSPI